MSEILGALFKYLVALLGASAVVAVFYLTLMQSKTQEAISQMVQLQTGIQQLYNGQPSFIGLNNAVAIASGLVPSNMINAGALFNPWGGAVVIAAANANANFSLSTAGVPQDACTKLTMALGAAGTSIVGGTINAAAVAAPFTIAAVSAACNAPLNIIVVTYQR
jgi:hypothetical protein